MYFTGDILFPLFMNPKEISTGADSGNHFAPKVPISIEYQFLGIESPLPVCMRDARQTNRIRVGRFSISSGCFFPMSMCGWIGRDTWILTSSVCVGSAYFMHERNTSPAYLIGTKGTAKPVYLPAWRSGKNGVNKIAWLPRRLELWSLHSFS